MALCRCTGEVQGGLNLRNLTGRPSTVDMKGTIRLSTDDCPQDQGKNSHIVEKWMIEWDERR